MSCRVYVQLHARVWLCACVHTLHNRLVCSADGLWYCSRRRHPECVCAHVCVRLLCVRLRPSLGVWLKHTSVARLREMDSAA